MITPIISAGRLSFSSFLNSQFRKVISHTVIHAWDSGSLTAEIQAGIRPRFGEGWGWSGSTGHNQVHYRGTAAQPTLQICLYISSRFES